MKAIENDQLEGFPFMKTKMVRKYLAPSPATSKGRMKRPQSGIRSTRKTSEPEAPAQIPEEEEQVSAPGQSQAHVIPNDNDGQISNVFCYASLSDKISGTLRKRLLSAAFMLRQLLCHMRAYSHSCLMLALSPAVLGSTYVDVRPGCAGTSRYRSTV